MVVFFLNHISHLREENSMGLYVLKVLIWFNFHPIRVIKGFVSFLS